MPQSPYILLVEDNPGDAHLTRALLAEVGTETATALHWVQSVDAAVNFLETAPGCEAVLLDLGLPDGQGLATLQAIRPYAQECPIVVLTFWSRAALTPGSCAAASGSRRIASALNARCWSAPCTTS